MNKNFVKRVKALSREQFAGRKLYTKVFIDKKHKKLKHKEKIILFDEV